MDQLAGVLGHEIGHVVRRHSVKQMEQQQGANIGVTLALHPARASATTRRDRRRSTSAARRCSRSSAASDEAEADAEGIKNVVRAGISPNGIPEMFQILINERESNPSVGRGLVRDAPAGGRPHRGDASADRADQPCDPADAEHGHAALSVVQGAHPVAAAVTDAARRAIEPA